MDTKQSAFIKSDQMAAALRCRFAEHHVYLLDLLASPGSGKTSTILATIEALRDEFNIAVVESDKASNADVERIKAQGIAAVRVDVGSACFLDAEALSCAVDELDLARLDLVIVENAGSLARPADFDLGENAKAVILSVSEGDAKPLECPDAFRASQAVVLNKVDTVAAFGFDCQAFCENVRQANPQVPIFPIVATKGEGVEEWAMWLAEQIRAIQ